MTTPSRSRLHPYIPSLLAALAACSTASAVVVWSDDFSGYGTPPNFNGPPNRDFTGNGTNDWVRTAVEGGTTINTSIGVGDNTSLVQRDEGTTAPVAAVYRDQWATTTPLNSTNHILRVSFDMRVASFTPLNATDATNPRFILRDTNTSLNNLGIGFGRIPDDNDGNSADFDNALSFYVTNQDSAGTNPSTTNAIGLGQAGFNFGTTTTSTGTGTTFIRFSYEYDYNTGAVVGVATNLDTGDKVTFTSSLNQGLDFANSANPTGTNRDGLILAAGGGSQSLVLWDNISVEILIPEPSSLLLSFVGAGFLLRRRRAAA